ncbi:hypothetical protein AMECASPLE_035957 [Ameca splendens]|uniref:Neural proliferation differentiation and control protein 1 n=1 Tax=Ameca splendens TaxID=208324 RepID=A0ABV1AF02_9TELE
MPAPPSQYFKLKKLIESSSVHRGSPTEQPTSLSNLLNTTTPPSTTNHTPGLLSDPLIIAYPSNDHVFIIMSSVFIAAGSLALIIAGVCWVRLQKGVRLTQKVDYPAYGMIKAQTFGNFPGDKKLAHSAQMYHYQHQKQQMLSLEKSRDEPRIPDSGASTDEENEDGDFTVYECPGLAPVSTHPISHDMSVLRWVKSSYAIKTSDGCQRVIRWRCGICDSHSKTSCLLSLSCHWMMFSGLRVSSHCGRTLQLTFHQTIGYVSKMKVFVSVGIYKL